MKVLGLSDGRWFKHDVWLEAYDLEADPPADQRSTFSETGAVVTGPFGGRITLTLERMKALEFPSSAAAMAAWNAHSVKRPRRPDGRLNKPLTALTIELEPTS